MVEHVAAQAGQHLFVHGMDWTVKDLFTYPNEFIYWSVQIVMYPYMTGLVAGAFVLSSLYHVFGHAAGKFLPFAVSWNFRGPDPQ